MHQTLPLQQEGICTQVHIIKKVRHFSSTTPAQWSANQKFKQEEIRNIGQSLSQRIWIPSLHQSQ